MTKPGDDGPKLPDEVVDALVSPTDPLEALRSIDLHAPGPEVKPHPDAPPPGPLTICPPDFDLAERIVELMNEALALDYQPVLELVQHRVRCIQDLVEHPSIQAGPMEDGGPNVVGLLGILNGIAGAYETGWGAVAAIYEQDGTLSGFKVLRPEGEDLTRPAGVGA